MLHFYTPEQIIFLKETAPGKPWVETVELFNNHFDTKLTFQKIRAVAKRYKINNGICGRFQKGQVPFNKGMKGVDFCGENGKKTQFKKGRIPLNYRSVGSERVSVDGYVDIKIADPNVWKAKHRVIWEEANGPVPNGHCLLFLDSNKLNVDLKNLQLITRSQLAKLNQNNLITDDAEMTKTGIVIADIYSKINEKKKLNEH